MVPSFYIPLNYVSMALSLLALIALAVLVSALGKVGFRSYVVGIVAFISTYYVTDIVMTLLVMVGFGSVSDTLFDLVKLIFSVLLQVTGLRFFMHVYLKRHTYAVFYGAGLGFAMGNTFIELLTSFTGISVATMMKEGSITQEFAQMYEPYVKEIENIALAESIANALYPVVMTAVYVALASVIGHAVRGEGKYLYYSMGGWFGAGLLLTLQDTFGLTGWTKIVTYVMYVAVALMLCNWSKEKYGLEFNFNRKSDYHAPLSRRVDKNKKSLR